MGDLRGMEPLDFDYETAAALTTNANGAADAIENQTASRASYVSTAQAEFQGYFAGLFADNAAVAAGDASQLVTRLREIATWAGQLADAARDEDARRTRAREWQERQDNRNVFDHIGDFFTGGEEPPSEPAADIPSFAPATVNPTPRTPLTGGGGGGISAAKPEDLRTFATGSSTLNSENTARPGTLERSLSDFASNCNWGTIDGSGVVSGFREWNSANEQDVTWATTVADAFAAAGGEGNVSRVSDASLLAALQNQGVGASRDGLVIDPAEAEGMPPTTGYAVDPVNTTTGNFIEFEVDLELIGAAATARVERTYNSLSEHVGVFGPGWSSVLETRLELADDGATLVLADGRAVPFPRAGDGWGRAANESRWLAAEPADAVPGLPGDRWAGDLLVVRDNRGGWLAFTPAGVWLGSGSGAGTGVRAIRDRDGLVARLLHANGRFIDVEHAGGLVAVARSSDGRRVEYGYDDAGRLVSATVSGATRTYRWNDAGLVDRVTSAAGVVEADNDYDAKGRVVLQRTQHGREVRFAYLPGRITVVSDPDGTRSNTWIADAKGRLVGVVDADDRRQSMAYDSVGNVVSVTERDGSITVHAYDERGRRTRTLTPSGADITYGYDELDRVTVVVTEGGAVVAYEYEGDDRNPSLLVDPEGGRTTLAWDGPRLTEVVDPEGVRLRLRYDAFGDLAETENAAGDVARLERDAAGRIAAAVSPSGVRTEYRYDDAGLLVGRQDADGARWRFEHDGAGRPVAVVDPLGARTSLAYGEDGELASTTDPLGRVVARTTDDQGMLAGLTLPDGAEWAFTHDALSRLTEARDPSGGVWRREYDATGALTAVVDPTGVRQEASTDRRDGTATLRDAFGEATLRFDEFGRPTQVGAPDGSSELTTYDRCGRPVEHVDGEGGLTRIERDAAGRVTAIVTPAGRRTEYEYDACGRPAASVDAAGARTTLAYDADSRAVERTLATGEAELIEYDAVGRVTVRRVPGRGTSRYGYDRVGRLTSVQDPWFGQRRFRYDEAGQLTAAIDGVGGVTEYEYDARGRVVRITDPAGGVTRRAFDAGDRVTEVVDPLGRASSARYDAAGRQTWQRDPDGRTTEWTHDAAGREASVSVDGRLVSEAERDALGRRLVVTDHTRGDGRAVTHELRYDRRGLLVERRRGERGLSWEYDADGARTALVDADGTRTTYRRDDAGRLVGVERGGLDAAEFRYDAAGRLIQAVSGCVLQSWRYEGGFPVEHASTSPDGATTTEIERDEDGRIVAVGDVRYEFDGAGQLVGLHGPDGAKTWRYDAAGRLLEERTPAGSTLTVPDAAGQLRMIEGAGERVELVYDGLGRRVRRIEADGSATEYAWGELGSVERVVERDRDERVLAETRVWVDALGELAEIATGGEQGAEAWQDTAAGTARLVSLGGVPVLGLPGGVTAVGDDWVTAGWRGARATDPEDPWAVLAAVGAAAGGGLPAGVSFTATGGVQLAGLEWLGARAYDPAARGFLSTDPLPATLGAGWAGNPYSYAGNDPLHASDPLGLAPATDADLAAYAEANQGAFAAAGAWWDDNWEYVVAGAAIVGGVALMATGVGGPAGIAMMAGAGALMSGGISVASQKAQTGDVDWGRVGIDAAVGGVLGGAGGAAGAFGRAAMASAPASQAARAVAVNVGVNAAVGAGGGATTYLVNNGGRIENGWHFAGAVLGGGVSGGVGGLAGPAGGTIARNTFGQSSTGWVAQGATALIGGAGSASGTAVQGIVSGEGVNGVDMLVNGAISTGSSYIPNPGPSQQGVNTLAQVPYFSPRTVSGAVNLTQTNTQGLWGSALGGSLVGGGVDTVRGVVGWD